MRGLNGWSGTGVVAMVTAMAMAMPAAAQGRAAPAAEAAATAAPVAAAPAATRWITGARVRLRGGPSDAATVLRGLSVNDPLQVVGVIDDWCEVDGGDGARGWVACRYLGDAPVDLEAITRLYDDRGRPNPRYDPLRHFAIDPQWSTLAAYAWELDARRRAVGERGRPTPDPALDAMKDELSKGAYGAPPARRRDVAALQAFAAEAIRTGEPDIRIEAAREIAGALQLWNETAFPYDGEQALGALAAVALPPARPSLFANDAAVAAAGDTPSDLSGRFGIVHRYVFRPASNDAADDPFAALYDIGAATNLLVRPLQRVQLFADGTLATEASHARQPQALHDDEHGCGGWTPGFAFGALDADDPAWAAYGDWMPEAHAEAAQPAGALYVFHVPVAPPVARATVSLSHATLDPATTGFASATTRVFDLDHDAVPDLMVWEGTGPGAGHLDGPTGTDDTWYRLVLVNTGGRWKVLGTDQFSYGCGC